MRKIVCVILAAWVFVVYGKHESYDGYKVYKINLKSESQYERIKVKKHLELDFWTCPIVNVKPGLVMVTPDHQEEFKNILQENEIESQVHIENVYRYLNQIDNDLINTNRNYGNRTIEFDAYPRYDEIVRYLETLERQHYEHMSLSNGELTSEGRFIKYVQLSTTRFIPTSTKPVIVVEAGINPREWISPMVALHIIKTLLDDSLPRPSFFLQIADWVIIPMVNPDGYEYTHTNLRLWTKTRSTTSYLGFVCPGVDVNRNFDISWMESDSSSSPCSHLYAGSEPFSEPESRIIRNVLAMHSHRISAYISIQNNGGHVLYPWRNATVNSNTAHLQVLARDIISGFNSNEQYTAGGAASVLGEVASGTSSDYVHAAGVNFVYNIEVADYGSEPFSIAENNILSVAGEIWGGISRVASYFYIGYN